MDKIRVVCVDKALFIPKFNVKVANSITNGCQYDLDFILGEKSFKLLRVNFTDNIGHLPLGLSSNYDQNEEENVYSDTTRVGMFHFLKICC